MTWVSKIMTRCIQEVAYLEYKCKGEKGMLFWPADWVYINIFGGKHVQSPCWEGPSGVLPTTYTVIQMKDLLDSQKPCHSRAQIIATMTITLKLRGFQYQLTGYRSRKHHEADCFSQDLRLRAVSPCICPQNCYPPRPEKFFDIEIVTKPFFYVRKNGWKLHVLSCFPPLSPHNGLPFNVGLASNNYFVLFCFWTILVRIQYLLVLVFRVLATLLTNLIFWWG